eukprot:798055_1
MAASSSPNHDRTASRTSMSARDVLLLKTVGQVDLAVQSPTLPLACHVPTPSARDSWCIARQNRMMSEEASQTPDVRKSFRSLHTTLTDNSWVPRRARRSGSACQIGWKI